MASITIRNLDDQTKARLRLQAARHGRSMEEEARSLLRTALGQEPTPGSRLGTAISSRFQGLGGVEIDLPARKGIRDPARAGK
jgi:plasmid stability protein